MKWLRMIALAGVLASVTGTAFADYPTEAINKAHIQFKMLTKKNENWRKIGFASERAVDETKVGVAKQVVVVDLNSLRQFRGNSAEHLLRPTDHYVVPLLHKNSPHSSFTVEKIRGVWETTSYGSPQLTRLLESATGRLSREFHLPENAFFLVQVPALNQYFVAFHRGGETMVSPLVAAPEFNLHEGAVLPLSSVAKTLQPVAAKHNGLPG